MNAASWNFQRSGSHKISSLLPGWLPFGCRVRCREFPCLSTGKACKSEIFYYLSLSPATKATTFFRKIYKIRFAGQTVVYRFFKARCRISLPVLPTGLPFYGGSLWKKAKIRTRKYVLSWFGSSPGRSPWRRLLNRSLSARPASVSRTGWTPGKPGRKLRKNG